MTCLDHYLTRCRVDTKDGCAPPSVNHAAEAVLVLVLVTHCMSGTWGEWSIFSIYQTSLFTGGVSPPSRQDRAGPGARWKCLIRSHKGSGECGVYCLNRDTARCWSALYCPLPGQGCKHVNMNEYTRLLPAASHCQDTLTLHPRVLFARCHNTRALGVCFLSCPCPVVAGAAQCPLLSVYLYSLCSVDGSTQAGHNGWRMQLFHFVANFCQV